MATKKAAPAAVEPAARPAEAAKPMKKITIPHVSRIEGHARITIKLDAAGQVADAQFHVTQVRGFEKFTEGRPYYEMPSITSRICGICPVSHELASSKACDSIMAVRIPETATKLRELLHMAQFVQSHALSFFHLSAPDLLLGMDFDPARRNVAGLLEEAPDALRDGIALRKFGQTVIERLAKERIHPAWVVPGGVNAPLDPAAREKTLAELPAATAIVKRTLELWKKTLDGFPAEIDSFSNFPTSYCGLVGPDGSLRLYDGNLRFVGPDGSIVADQVKPWDYAEYIGEATLPDSYLKAPYYRPVGFPDGIYRVGPMARLNVADRCGTPLADAELAEYRERLGVGSERPVVQSGFHYHYARLIEATYGLERMQQLLDDPAILGAKFRAHAGVNELEGIGVIEAPRGTLIHHYKVNDDGAMTWANLIVATGHNNLAMGRGVLQVAKRFVDGNKIQEGALNRVSALVRAYDPCLSCSTHALGLVPTILELRDSDGELVDEIRG
jgi:NAD-reducing hydrogenase large subunit